MKEAQPDETPIENGREAWAIGKILDKGRTIKKPGGRN